MAKVVYWSQTGNTQTMAEAVAKGSFIIVVIKISFGFGYVICVVIGICCAAT